MIIEGQLKLHRKIVKPHRRDRVELCAENKTGVKNRLGGLKEGPDGVVGVDNVSEHTLALGGGLRDGNALDALSEERHGIHIAKAKLHRVLAERRAVNAHNQTLVYERSVLEPSVDELDEVIASNCLILHGHRVLQVKNENISVNGGNFLEGLCVGTRHKEGGAWADGRAGEARIGVAVGERRLNGGGAELLLVGLTPIFEVLRLIGPIALNLVADSREEARR